MKKYILLLFAVIAIQFSFAQSQDFKQVYSHLVAASDKLSDAKPDIQSLSNLPYLSAAGESKDKLAILIAPSIIRHYHPEYAAEEVLKKSIYLAYMAGYQPEGQVLSTWQKAYSVSGQPDWLPASNKLKPVIQSAETELKKLLPVFEMANYLSMIGEYGLAGKCYHHILQVFPSREVYNNLAVSLALSAYRYMDSDDEVLFLFPFELDTKSRMGRQKSGDTNKQLRAEILRKAREYAKKAMLLDTAYATGYVNYASVVCMIGDYDEGIYYARRGFSKATTEQSLTRSNARLVEAIAWHTKGKKQTANALFAEAENLAGEDRSSLAKVNRRIAETGQKPTKAETEEIINGNAIEALEDLDMEGASTNFKSTIIDDPDYLIVKLGNDIIAGYPMEKSRVLVYYTPQKDGVHSVYGLHMTYRDYDETTARGIQREDFIDDVEEKYGKPTLIRTSRQGKLAYYERAEILFFFDPYDEVRGWGVVNECENCRD